MQETVKNVSYCNCMGNKIQKVYSGRKINNKTKQNKSCATAEEKLVEQDEKEILNRTSKEAIDSFTFVSLEET